MSSDKEVYKNSFKQNYLLVITIGFVLLTISLHYIYNFQVLNIILSYVLGCLACLLFIRSEVLNNYLDHLTNLLCKRNDVKQSDKDKKICLTCEEIDCQRHKCSIDLEPWSGLRIHKQLDQAIEDFYNVILHHFVSSWFNTISHQPFFIDELRSQLRYASASLVQRAYKKNFSKFIMEKLLPCALHHYTLYKEAQRQQIRVPNMSIDRAALAGPLKFRLHPAVTSRSAELKYLRSATKAVMPFLLKTKDANNRVLQVLIREIFAGWVLLPLTDVLSDPYILNTLIILITDEDGFSPLPKSPDYNVEFLENFVRRSESEYIQRAKLYSIDVDYIMGNQDYFYSFIQYMKSIGKFHILQIYKDINELQVKLLNPDITTQQEKEIIDLAKALQQRYSTNTNGHSELGISETIGNNRCTIQSDDTFSIEERTAIEIGKALMSDNVIVALRCAPQLYVVATNLRNMLSNVYIPAFMHSDDFYKLYLGFRSQSGYSKLAAKRPPEKCTKRTHPKPLDGDILDVFTTAMKVNSDVVQMSDNDCIENVDILRYLDNLAEHARLEEHDLSQWRVHLSVADEKQGTGWSRLFHVNVDKGGGTGCFVLRSDIDFHLLKDKLNDFHGQHAFTHTVLPHLKTTGPAELVRYKYEDFIQQLLREPLLKASDLLRLFLTANDFHTAVNQHTLGNTDTINMYQVLAHRLKKEKGQHLDAFMNAFLLSTDMERYQAMKQGANRDVEEAEDVIDTLEYITDNDFNKTGNPRSIASDVFGDNFATTAERILQISGKLQDDIKGFSQCLLFILSRVFCANKFIVNIFGGVCVLYSNYIDIIFNNYFNNLLADIVSHRRLAKLIRKGHDLLFGSAKLDEREDDLKHRELARERIQKCSPVIMNLLLGAKYNKALDNIFNMVQSPQLNKQLIYNLLDLCLAELFPELVDNVQ